MTTTELSYTFIETTLKSRSVFNRSGFMLCNFSQEQQLYPIITWNQGYMLCPSEFSDFMEGMQELSGCTHLLLMAFKVKNYRG